MLSRGWRWRYSVGGAKLLPSMMCVDYRHLERDIRMMEQAGCEYLHFDVMDGHFVPNFTLGPDFMRAVRAMTELPFDIHLMVERPEDCLHLFPVREGDYLSVHAEATNHLQRALRRIHDAGAMAAVALNPATPVEAVRYVLPDIRMLLVMTVNPGFAGQKMVPTALEKIRDARRFLDENGCARVPVAVDGNVSFETAPLMRQSGAELFVCGTSSLFAEGGSLRENATKFRACIE